MVLYYYKKYIGLIVMARLYRRNTQQPFASTPYPHYSGFFGYIQPYNDGVNSKILRTDGTMHVGRKVPEDPQTCSYTMPPGPSSAVVSNYRMIGGKMRWCPSDHYSPLTVALTPNQAPAGFVPWTPSNYG